MKDLKLIPINKDITERDFPKEMRKKGWECLRLIKRNYKSVNAIIRNYKNDFWGISNINNMESVGKPDFFIYKNQRFYFCEFKSKKDMLSNNQLTWMSNHIDYPKALAFVSLKKRNIHKLDIDQETINKSIDKFIDKNTQRVIKDYLRISKDKDYIFDEEYSFFRDVIEKKLKECIENGDFILDIESKNITSLNLSNHLYFYYK